MPGILSSTNLAQPSLQRLHEGLQMLREAHQQEGRSIDGLRLKARQLKDGRVMVYLKAGQPSRLSQLRTRMFGDDVLRRVLGQALKPALRDAAVWADEDAQSAALDLMQMSRKPGKTIDAAGLLGHLQRLTQTRADAQATHRPADDQPSMAWFAQTLESGAFADCVKSLGKTLTMPPGRARDQSEKELAATLGNTLGLAVRDRSSADQLCLMVGDDHRLVDDLSRVLRHALASRKPVDVPARQGDSTGSGPSLRAIVRDALVQARTHLNDRVSGPIVETRIEGDTTRWNVPAQVSLGGRQFELDKALAQGGFGVVCRYRCTTDPSKVVVVKVPRTKEPDRSDLAGWRGVRKAYRTEARAEVAPHLAAVKGGNTTTIGLEGVIQMPDGGLAIALEYAPNGDIEGVLGKLAADSPMTPQTLRDPASTQGYALRATLAQGMLAAMEELQTRGISHLDIKGPNFLLDDQGKVKVCDFGLAQTADMRPFGLSQASSDRPGNPRWLDPRIQVVADQIQAQRDVLTHEIDAQLRQLKLTSGPVFAQIRDLKKLAPGEVTESGETASAAITRLEARITEMKAENARLKAQRDELLAPMPSHAVVSGFGADRWSCAVVIYQLFTGKLPFDGDRDMQISTLTRDFIAQSPERQRSILFDQAPGVPPAVQNVILDLMLASDRSLRDILASDAFSQPGVGSEQTRLLICELAQQPAH